MLYGTFGNTRTKEMGGGYNWTWPQIPSLTAMKYQRHGYVEVVSIQRQKQLHGPR